MRHPRPKGEPIRGADRDPDSVGEVLDQLATGRSWAAGLAIARLRDRWEDIVGPILVSRCEPSKVREDGMLEIRCDHGASANEVSMLANTIVEKAREHAGTIAIVGVVSLVRRARRD